MARSATRTSGTPKEPREHKLEKRKRLENYRVAKAQAKKYVIPGIIAVLVCVFLMFGTMYGFRGTKSPRRERALDRLYKDVKEQQMVDPEVENKKRMMSQFSAVFKDETPDEIAVDEI
ncbi:hypothetical protein BGZ83_008716 [Gryganskiella cystojenkinii]|nr:hypothetical protein BGZ83_008716 [Gryganskiella cystojenkinii]